MRLSDVTFFQLCISGQWKLTWQSNRGIQRTVTWRRDDPYMCSAWLSSCLFLFISYDTSAFCACVYILYTCNCLCMLYDTLEKPWRIISCTNIWHFHENHAFSVLVSFGYPNYYLTNSMCTKQLLGFNRIFRFGFSSFVKWSLIKIAPPSSELSPPMAWELRFVAKLLPSVGYCFLPQETQCCNVI